MKDAPAIPLMADGKRNITETVAAFSKKLFGFIRNRVDSTEDAEDILQDVFYQLAGNTEEIEQLSAWLYATTRNKITDRYRKKKNELLSDIFPESEDGQPSWEEIVFAAGDDAETKYLRNVFWNTLYTALDELPADQKNAFVMHELEGIPFEEISVKTNTPVATLISRKRYAVLHLRERLENVRSELLNY